MPVLGKDVHWQRILRDKTSEELKQLIEAAQDLLAERELHEAPPRRKVVESRVSQGVEYRLEMVKCGQTGCQKDKENEGHGPYWYSYLHSNGQIISRYLGKDISEELEGDL